MIADDHDLIRRGLRTLLGTRSGWTVVGEASNGVDAVTMAASLMPDIAILDFSMPGLTGPEAAARMRVCAPRTKVLVLTMHDSEEVLREVLQAGAKGFMLKSDADRDLLMAVQRISESDEIFVSERAVSLRGGPLNVSGAGKASLAQLTVREREVMRLLADGMTSKEAAARLCISTRTVESHRINISRKMSFGSVADLVRYAIRNGIAAQC